MRFLLMENVLYPLLSREEGMPISRYTTIPHNPTNHQFPYSKQLQQLLCGKELLSTEIPFSLEELFSHYQNGLVRFNRGISLEKGRRTCNRCNNKDERFFAFFDCAKCGERNCHYCRKCVMMGRVSECTPLFSWCGPIPASSKRITLQWDGSLSQGQSSASEEVLQTINTNDELLVWAV